MKTKQEQIDLNESYRVDVDIFIGFWCNLRCRHCSVEFHKTQPDLTANEIYAEIDRYQSLINGRLVITGGEPTIRKDLPDIIAYARTAGFRKIHLQTNATALSHRPLVAQLVNAGLTSTLVSLLGPTAEIHDAMTERPGSFYKTVKGIANLIDYGMQVSTNSVITKINLPHLEKLAQYITRNFPNIHTICFSYPQAAGGVLNDFDGITPSLSETVQYLLPALSIVKKGGYWTWVSDFPLCYLPGYEEHSSHIFPRLAITSDPDPTSNADAILDLEGHLRQVKVKNATCQKCALDEICIGVDQAYANYYGLDELSSIIVQ